MVNSCCGGNNANGGCFCALEEGTGIAITGTGADNYPYIISSTVATPGDVATETAARIAADDLLRARIVVLEALDALVFKGVINCSTNPNYPAANAGYTYRVSVAGKIGGGSGVNVEIGDLLICLADGTAAGNQATVGTSWTIAQTNIDGAVTGPVSATSGNLATFNGTSGKIIADSGVDPTTLAPKASPALTGTPTAPTASPGDNSTKIATTAYADTAVGAVIAASDAMVFKGSIDCSANPNYPAADRGHTYRVSVAGKIGGASGINVEVGDLAICLTDGTVAGTQAAVGTSWTIGQTNIDGAVVGPASATSGNLPTFNGITGKIIQDSGIAPATLAPLASPALTGNPTAPTPAAADNDTSIATTAFVQGELTAKAPLASPVLTGTPTAPTASPGDNSTSIATTAFVTAAIAADTDGWTYERLSGNLTESATTATDIFTGFAPTTGVTYEVEAYLEIDTAVSTTANIIGMNGPTGATKFAFKVEWMSAANTPAASLLSSAGAFSNATTTAANPSPALIRGRCAFTTPGAGNVRPQFKSEVNTSTVTIYAKSYLRWKVLP